MAKTWMRPGFKQVLSDIEVMEYGLNTVDVCRWIGRQFYSCPRPSESRCGFFLWADAADDAESSSRQTASYSHNSNFSRYETNALINVEVLSRW